MGDSISKLTARETKTRREIFSSESDRGSAISLAERHRLAQTWGSEGDESMGKIAGVLRRASSASSSVIDVV